MTSKIDDGDYAFSADDGYAFSCMSLRQWYAGMALSYIIKEYQFPDVVAEKVAKKSFEIADAMIAAGKVKP